MSMRVEFLGSCCCGAENIGLCESLTYLLVYFVRWSVMLFIISMLSKNKHDPGEIESRIHRRKI